MQVWENLTALANKYPVDGNKDGSYLTMLSKGGFVFGIINIIGNFGTVYNDQVGGTFEMYLWGPSPFPCHGVPSSCTIG